MFFCTLELSSALPPWRESDAKDTETIPARQHSATLHIRIRPLCPKSIVYVLSSLHYITVLCCDTVLLYLCCLFQQNHRVDTFTTTLPSSLSCGLLMPIFCLKHTTASGIQLYWDVDVNLIGANRTDFCRVWRTHTIRMSHRKMDTFRTHKVQSDEFRS